jgi:hypothetical protein
LRSYLETVRPEPSSNSKQRSNHGEFDAAFLGPIKPTERVQTE